MNKHMEHGLEFNRQKYTRIFFSTKTDSSNTRKILMEKLNNAQHVKKGFTH